jgi:hypothetical protein
MDVPGRRTAGHAAFYQCRSAQGIGAGPAD